MNNEKKKILEFLTNLKKENAKNALTNLAEIISLKEESRYKQVLNNLEDDNDK
jgi:hemerythrin superfamily protein